MVHRQWLVEHLAVVAVDEATDHLDPQRIGLSSGQVQVGQRGNGPGAVVGGKRVGDMCRPARQYPPGLAYPPVHARSTRMTWAAW